MSDMIVLDTESYEALNTRLAVMEEYYLKAVRALAAWTDDGNAGLVLVWRLLQAGAAVEYTLAPDLEAQRRAAELLKKMS